MPKCQQCQKDFIIYPQDKEFYKRMEVPEPTRCFSCRLQNLMAYRNEFTLYSTQCGLCNKSILSMYSSDHPAPVYCYDCWYSDQWDHLEHGQDYDFSRGFFEQFKELQDKVPSFGLSVFGNVNSDYTNCASWNKNSYLLAGANSNEDVLYGNYVNYDKYSVDLSFTHKSELCYENIDCENNYHVRFATDSSSCTDCAFIHDCKSCMDCFCCTGLRSGKYYILNKQYSENEYRQKMAEIDIGSYQTVAKYLEEFKKLKRQAVYKYYHGAKNENSTGDYIHYSKDCHHCFDATEIEGCAYVQWFHKSRNCYDIMAWGFGAENCYSCVEAGEDSTFIKFCQSSYNYCSHLEYCRCCMSCQDCFGCVGLHKNQFCIFNKQYSEAEYKKLKEKIINKMRQEGEYGQYFSVQNSPYAYNESIANDYFPLTKEEVLKRGWRWQDKLPGIYDKGTLSADKLPDNIKDVDDSITKEIIICADCQKNFKITPQELKLYQQIVVPLPRKCFQCRHLNRLKQRNPRQLWHRQCMKQGCDKEFKTTYAPERLEKVYCEECYNKEIY